MEKARFILDPPADGAWNMAVDQALLDSANQTGRLSIRFYQWSQPTLSLGYFQRFDDRTSHPPSADCPVVRRSTGGGAILHDQEITYSICVPSAHRWSATNEELYSLVHNLIVTALDDIGVQACLFEGPQQQNRDQFLCFQRRTSGDILLQNHKIGGSAQRRKKNALLQHGSLLLRKSNFAPELPGMEELKTILKFNQDGFVRHWAEQLAVKLGFGLDTSELSSEEKKQAVQIKSNFYGNDGWTKRR